MSSSRSARPTPRKVPAGPRTAHSDPAAASGQSMTWPWVKRRASEVGADDFLEKPFDVKVLLQQVEKHMQSKAQV